MQNRISHKTLKAIFLYDEIASLNIPIDLIFKYALAHHTSKIGIENI